MYIRSGLGTLRVVRERISHFKFEVAEPQPLAPALEVAMAEGVAASITRLGRCEDLRFSPDGSRLAVPGYKSKICLVLAVSFDEATSTVSLSDSVEVESPGFTQPHGLDFIDNETLAVGNRDSDIAIVSLPARFGARRVTIEPASMVTGKRFTRTHWPGSVAVYRDAAGELSVLACNNYIDRVSQHFLAPSAGYRETRSRIAFARGLHIPDGVAVSPDGQWIAISCHESHVVAVYSVARTGRLAAPVAEFPGAHFPHGLRFTPDGESLMVADAGSPYVHVYARGRGWEGSRRPVRSVRVLDEETYRRGRTMPSEGGPKGIDFDPRARMVAVCCEEAGIKFLPFAAFVGAGTSQAL